MGDPALGAIREKAPSCAGETPPLLGRPDRWNLIAFGWGVAEGVVFFVVPDVLLTFVAVRLGLRRGLQAVAWALGGAIIGGMLAFAWGTTSPASASTFMTALPAIDPEMIATVDYQVATEGPATLVTAPLHGRPYKLYAAASGAAGESVLSLVLWTIPGRLWRFLGLTLMFGVLAETRRRWASVLPRGSLIIFWAFFWGLVYAEFWF